MDLWPTTVAARRSLLETFESLDTDQWTQPSLCDGWTVREVLGHLVLAAHPPLGRFAVAAIRAGGSFDRANQALAVDKARLPVEELIGAYRSVLERKTPPGWPPALPYSDILLHTLDVRIPLGLDTDRPAEDYLPVAGVLFTRLGGPFTRSSRPSVRWVATDTSWSHGTGPEVRGALVDLALAAAGRPPRLDRLEGDGADAVRAWLR